MHFEPGKNLTRQGQKPSDVFPLNTSFFPAANQTLSNDPGRDSTARAAEVRGRTPETGASLHKLAAVGAGISVGSLMFKLATTYHSVGWLIAGTVVWAASFCTCLSELFESKNQQRSSSLKSILHKIGDKTAGALEAIGLKQEPLEKQLVSRPHVPVDEINRNPRCWKGTTLVVKGDCRFQRDRSYDLRQDTAHIYGDLVMVEPRTVHVSNYLYKMKDGQSELWVESSIKIPEGQPVSLIGKVTIESKNCWYLSLTEGWIRNK